MTLSTVYGIILTPVSSVFQCDGQRVCKLLNVLSQSSCRCKQDRHDLMSHKSSMLDLSDLPPQLRLVMIIMKICHNFLKNF
jgi:hypothetical protein